MLVLNSLRTKVKRFGYRLTLSATFLAIILITNGVLTPTIAYATDSGEEATDSETPVSTTETASSEVIQESDSEVEAQSTVEEEEPAEATADVSQAEPTEESSPPEVVTETVTSGGDDSSYRIPIEVPIIFDGVSYTDVYATTNSVITFGNPDGTYWDYPMTPTVSIYALDWWALPSHNPNMHFIIRTSEGGFQVDGAYLPYGTMQGEITNIVVTAQIQTNGTVSYTYSVVGPLYGGERTGARLNDGSVVPLEEAGVDEVEEPIVLEPTPVEPEPVYVLNAPTNLVVTPNADGSVTLTWDAPETSNTEVERYAVSWSTGSSGWGVASTTTSITLQAQLFESTGGLDTAYNFTVRADNDSLAVYSSTSTPVEATPSIIPAEPEPAPNVEEPETQAPQQPPTLSPPPSAVEPERTPPLPPQRAEPTPPPTPIRPVPVPQVVSPEPTSEDLLDEVLANPSSSVEERVDAIIATVGVGEAVNIAVLVEAGISFADLPPETPVELREDADGNAVVIDAETAASLEVFKSPQAFVTEVFTDPAQAVEAIRNIGKDMSEEEREESQEIVVASVVVANVANLASNAAAAGAAVTYRRKP